MTMTSAYQSSGSHHLGPGERLPAARQRVLEASPDARLRKTCQGRVAERTTRSLWRPGIRQQPAGPGSLKARAAPCSPWLLVLCLSAVALLCSGCLGRIAPPAEQPPRDGFQPSRFEQRGVASWYGPKFHGRKTANGETYNMYEMTAAHRYVPFETTLLVTNLDNGRRVRVRINDRGPFVKKRVIDLSYAAAKKLDMVASGTAPVRLTVHSPAPSAAETLGDFYIQTGSFQKLDNAETMHSRLIDRGYSGTRIVTVELEGQKHWRVQAGTFSNLEAAQQALTRLRKHIPASFIVAD